MPDPSLRHKTYADALFSAKRGFVIIGLTGYTGSGCSNTAGLLGKETKFDLPPTYRNGFATDDFLGDRQYAALKSQWDTLPWQPHTVIEVAVVIMALLFHQALSGNTPSSFPDDVNAMAEKNRGALRALILLRRDGPLQEQESRDLVNAYRLCATLLRQIKDASPIADFISMMQLAGDKIRLYGSWQDGPLHPDNMFIIPEAIRKIISSYKKGFKHRRFVIDAFRNPFEVEYFKRRYAEFYLLCLYRPPEDRARSLKMTMSQGQISQIWAKERGEAPTDGRNKEDCPKCKDNIGWWITGQDIPACAQKADVFISPRTGDRVHLKYQLSRLLVLIHKPGSLTPSKDEHSMQIASTARRMSGCLSRQVGAVVVGRNGYMLGIGWNNPPDGHVPCSLRTCEDLLAVSDTDDKAYSQFEKSERFRSHIERKAAGAVPFCFRSELQAVEKVKKAEYTRALHAEENAFLQTAKTGGNSLEDSTLFTTASTCTLCAKKAYHLGVQRIVYIDEYDDMALEQTLLTGSRKIRYEQFEGVTGGAYFSLFSPLIPEKDLVEYFC